MDCITAGLPVPHHLPEFNKVHIHWTGDATQSSHSLSPSSPFALNLSQSRGLFQRVSSLHQVAKVLELQLQHQSFSMNIQGLFPLGLTGLILLSKGLSRVFSSTTDWQHQFFSIQPYLWSNSHSHLYMTPRKDHSFDYKDLLQNGPQIPQSRWLWVFSPDYSKTVWFLSRLSPSC